MPFEKSLLKEDGVFVLDSGAAQPGLFVWLGKKADHSIKKKATTSATEWLSSVGRPDYTGISRVQQHSIHRLNSSISIHDGFG